MNRDEYRSLRRRYRQARRDDSRHTTMNASEWRRGVHQDRAGAIRASVPAVVAATLDKCGPLFPIAGDRLRAALARHHGRIARAANEQKKQDVIAAALAASRALDKTRRGA